MNSLLHFCVIFSWGSGKIPYETKDRLGWCLCFFCPVAQPGEKKPEAEVAGGGMIEYRKGYINQRLRLPAPSSRKGTGLSDGVIN